MKKKVLANFLPGFHKDSLNSKWWGDGFTEWENVKSAKPLFPGHNQPRNPILGYTDLAQRETIIYQAQLARKYGISGFMIYNYWYNGEKILYKPLEVIWENPDIEIEFSLCWGNHDWTRSWTNRSGALDTLIKQEYNLGDDCTKHAKYLSKFFLDKRYIKIQGKPIFQIYDLNEENRQYVLELKKKLLEYFDIDILIIQTLKSKKEEVIDIADSVIYFQPSYNLIQKSGFVSKVIKISANFPLAIKKYLYRLYDVMPSKPIKLDYDAVCKSIELEYANRLDKSILSMFVDFDNTPRYGKRARYFYNFSLEQFESTFRKIFSYNSFGDIYIINAWNEWGEGMYLEPDNLYGYRKLEAIHNILNSQ